jgi:hypothetical protein
MRSWRLASVVISACAAQFCVSAQSVVTARSGVVSYFEGSVSIDRQTLEHRTGRFIEIKPGSELRTGAGRAEILLTPGVLLRVGDDSAVRMVSNRLIDTRLEFVSGAAALDSRNAAPGDPITISYKDYQMRFARSGRYRMDSTPAQLRVEEGEADVVYHTQSATLKAGQALPFSPKLVACANDQTVADDLSRWENDRNASLSAENKAAADSDNLTEALNNAPADSYGSGSGGYPGTLTPDPAYGGTYYGAQAFSPFWLYGAPFFNAYMPIYLPVAVRRVLPYRIGTLSPSRIYTPTRTGSSTFRTSTPVRVAPARPVFRPSIHR